MKRRGFGGAADPALMPAGTDRVEPDDVEVLARMATGDVEIFGVIIRRYVRPATLLANQLVGDADEAEDVVEESFLIVMAHAATFDPGLGRFENWLYGIVRRIARKHNLRRHRRVRLWERWRPQPRNDPGPSRATEARETLGQVAQVLNELPEMQQRCFEMHVVRGLEVSEVAAMYEISSATVRQHVFRARRVIRERLGTMEDV